MTFSSHMVFSGDHRIIETTRWGLGVESDLRVDDVGSLVYEIRKYVLRCLFLADYWIPHLGLAFWRWLHHRNRRE